MSDLAIRTSILKMHLRQSFATSSTSVTGNESLIVRWGNGLGEGTPSIHYGPRASEIEEGLQSLIRRYGGNPDPTQPADILDMIPEPLYVGRSAVEMASLDHNAKHENKPLWQYLGLSQPQSVQSSLTITRGSEVEMRDQLERAKEFTCLKLKVGFEGDLDFIDSVLSHGDFRLRLDVNGGWSVEETIENLRSLAGYSLEFVEQPLAEPGRRELDKIKTKVDCKVFLDESIMNFADLEHFAPVIDGVNLKLSRCGGITSTIILAKRAWQLNLQLLLGCMLESAVGITAALNLASLFDYFDLDSILLTEDDPFWGAHFSGDELILPEGEGIAITCEDNTYA